MSSISLNPDGSWTVTDIVSYWHATPTERTDQVLREGLVLGRPQSFTKAFPGSRLGRIYLSPHPGNLADLMAAGVDLGLVDTGKYTVIEVVLPVNTVVCRDPDDLGFFSVYVKETIPKACIRAVGTIELSLERSKRGTSFAVYGIDPPDLEDLPLQENIPRKRSE